MAVCQPNSSIQSSSFSPPPPPRQYKYDLFLSFRREDICDNFVYHLCKELLLKGIQCYIYDEKQEIGPELLKVIEESKFSIVVFSTNYASSRWCLNELVKILECKATTITTSAVYPVFYYVDPSDVGNQAGDFGKGLEKLLSRNDTMDSVEVQRWKDALKEAGSLTKEWVYPSQKIVRSEAKFIEELVGDIISKLYHPYVDPSDVENQAGDFGKGLEKLLSRNDTMDSEVQRWKDALKEVSSLTKEWVYPSQKIVRSEVKFIEELVGDIISKLYRPYSGSGSAELFSSPYLCLFGTGPLTRQLALWPNCTHLTCISLHQCWELGCLPNLDEKFPNLRHLFLQYPDSLVTPRSNPNYGPFEVKLDSWLPPPNLSSSTLKLEKYFLEAFPENSKLPSSNISQLDHLHTTDEFMMVDCFEIDDFSFLGPFLGCYLTGPAEHLKVRIVSSQYIFEWRILFRSASLECLESERHSFSTPSPRLWSPLDQLDFLRIINSMSQLMGIEKVFLENLEINGCPFMSFPIKSKLATNLRQLKITNCTSLQLLPVGLIHNNSSLDMLHIEGCPSLISFPESEPSSPDSASNTFLKLTKLEIWDCVKLKSLPLCLHQFTFLSILSISNCPRLVSFPEGGLPSNLTSLLIYECESLRFLPDNMHKLASLQVLSIYGCPSLTFFPEGGLPIKLVSLSVIDCENLCPIHQWELHKLIKLEQFTVMGVCSHLDL